MFVVLSVSSAKRPLYLAPLYPAFALFAAPGWDRLRNESLRNARAIDPGDQIYSTNYHTPAVCWILKRTDIRILGRGGELQYGLNYPDAKNRQTQIPELAKMMDDCNRTTGNILMITERDYSSFRRYLPEASLMEKASGFVFLKYVSPLENSRKL